MDLGTRVVALQQGEARRLGLLGEGRGIRLLSPDFSRLADVLALSPAARRAVLDGAVAGDLAGDAVLLPLVDPGASVWALALNYDGHVKEGGHETPKHPVLFLRVPDSFSAPGQALIKPPQSEQFDYEGELAVFIGLGGRHIRVEDAAAHIGGYACCNEGSVREWQRHSSQITAGKNFWRSGAIGPWLRLADGEFDPYPMRLRTHVNGVEVQSAAVGEMCVRIDELIAYVSNITPLRAGDVLLMGTPGGVGLRRDPPLFLWPGDEVRVEIDGLGTLCNTVAHS